jgi:hypothetical protein
VARRMNAWFSSIDFTQLRRAVVSSDDFEQAAERFRALGAPPLEPLLDSEIEVNMDSFPGGGTVTGGRGLDAFLGFWKEWLEPWEELALEEGRYEELGDHAIVEMRVTARGGIRASRWSSACTSCGG